MRMIAITVVSVLAGCTQEAAPSGPASLQLVPPGFYSSRPPPRVRASPPATLAKKLRYLPAEPRPTERQGAAQGDAVSDDIQGSLDDAAQALERLRKKLRNDIR